MDYVTLYQLRAELGLGADQTGDDALLRRHLRAGTAWIEQQCRGRHFDPRRATRRYSARDRQLLLDDDLQEVLSLTNGDASAVTASQYRLLSANQRPYWGLRLRDSATIDWEPDAAGDYDEAVALEGVWFYHDNPEAAWADSLDTVLDDPLADDATEITVEDPLAAPADSAEPRFQVGNLIRLSGVDGDELPVFEYCLVRAVTPAVAAIEADPEADPPVEAVDAVPGVLTVQRAVNGTAAREWTAETVIHVFRPWENAQRALMRIVTFSYRTKDGKPTERISVLGNSQQVVPGGIPADVLDLLPVPLVVR